MFNNTEKILDGLREPTWKIPMEKDIYGRKKGKPCDICGGDWKNALEDLDDGDYKKHAGKECHCIFCINNL